MKTKRFLIVAEVEYAYTDTSLPSKIDADAIRWDLIAVLESKGYDINSFKVVQDRDNL